MPPFALNTLLVDKCVYSVVCVCLASGPGIPRAGSLAVGIDVDGAGLRVKLGKSSDRSQECSGSWWRGESPVKPLERSDIDTMRSRGREGLREWERQQPVYAWAL